MLLESYETGTLCVKINSILIVHIVTGWALTVNICTSCLCFYGLGYVVLLGFCKRLLN